MKFPKRVIQHKSQSESFAILLYKLKNIGIFRNLTENDYGIDFEIELVEKEHVTGKYIKAQVKSAQDVYIRQDGIPTVGNIKQSTLLYWTELSYKSPVIVFAVDLKSEDIYYSQPVFWQATKLIDNTESTKTIEFNKIFDESKFGTEDEKIKLQVKNFLTSFLISIIFIKPSLEETLYAHRSALRNYRDFHQLYIDCFHYDYHSEFDQKERLQHFLEISKILLFDDFFYMKEKTEDEINVFDYRYWLKKDKYDLTNFVVQTPLKILFPRLITKLKKMKDDVKEGFHYWIHKDIAYFELVLDTHLPEDIDHDTLFEYNLYERKTGMFYDFLCEKNLLKD